MKIIKIILAVLAGALIIIQFFGIEKNQGGAKTNHISTQFTVPEGTEQILKIACYDCHSNSTVYPWYTTIQPVGWWMQHHVDEGRGELNFDEFASYTPRRQYHKMEETIEMVKGGKMPLSSYTWMHGDAQLTQEQKENLVKWSDAVMQEIKARNPGTGEKSSGDEHKE